MHHLGMALRIIARCVLLGLLAGWCLTGFGLQLYVVWYIGGGLFVGLVGGLLLGFLNGLLISAISLTWPTTIPYYSSYQWTVVAAAFLLTLIASFIGFALLTRLPIVAIPCAIFASLGSLLASEAVAHWYWGQAKGQRSLSPL